MLTLEDFSKNILCTIGIEIFFVATVWIFVTKRTLVLRVCNIGEFLEAIYEKKDNQFTHPIGILW
jgi:hypothetical protein